MKLQSSFTHFRTLIATALLVASFSISTSSAQWFNEGNSRSDFSSDLKKIDEIEKSGPARQRAVNLARSTAIALNGGLSRYMPDSCMFSSSASGCLRKVDYRGFLFVFKGGNPGWQVLGYAPTKITEILISPDGKSVVEVAANRDI